MFKTDVHSRQFVWLDRLCWLAWLVFPFLIWSTYQSLNDANALQAQLPDIDPNCVKSLPQVPSFSPLGKAATFGYLAAQYVIYAVLLALAHLTIHRCAVGKIFVADTLKTLGIAGAIIVAWPFVDLALGNLHALLLYRTGDLKSFTPNYLFDVAPFGVGLLILTMRAVIRHAIALKQDNDLTI